MNENKIPQSIAEAHRQNEELNAQDHPVMDLWKALKPVVQLVREMQVTVPYLKGSFDLLDTVQDDDSILSSDELTAVRRFYSIRMPMSRAQSRLAHALTAIQEARQAVAHTFQGEARVRYFERLERFHAEASDLVQLFDTPPALPETPATIRQETLALVLHSFDQLFDQVTQMRQEMHERTLPEGFYIELLALQADIFALKSALQDWQSNPRQKLSILYGQLVERFQEVTTTTEKLYNNAQFECQELGFKFFNRCGQTSVKRIA